MIALMALLSSVGHTIAPPPTVTRGVLDLQNWNLARDGPVRLDGDWEFYWDESVRSLGEPIPKEFMRVPGSWRQAGHPTKGKAVYRVQVLTQLGQQIYGMKLYEFPQSYRVYVNNNPILENGTYAEIPEDSRRSLVRPVALFAHAGPSMDIRIEAVNLNEKEPGPRRSIIFGLESDVRKVQDGQLIADMLVIGVLLIMALYHLGLYVQRRREIGSLLFGLLCLIMIFRITVTEEHYLTKYSPQFPGQLESLLDVFSFFVLVPAFAWIFSYFFREDFHHWVLKVVSGVFLVAAALHALTESPLLFNFYLFFTLMVGLYLCYVLFMGVKRRRSGSVVFLAGFLLFVATTVWDMLSYSNIVRTIYVSQIGFVGFIFAQAYVLSMRFNKALTTSEQLTSNLETLVVERTSALEESNRKLVALNVTDALTGISNRRHFDDMLHSEWNRALRTGRPLALLLLDVDHFKAYNDHYGHQGGDACLQVVAKLLEQNVHRAGDTLARYGGEEFVILLAECTGDEALALAEKIRQGVQAAALPHVKSTSGIVSVSIGVHSMIPTDTTTADQLVKAADQALYRAKHQGRNNAVLAI